MVVVNRVVYGAASPAPPVLVTLFECNITVYFVPVASGVLVVRFSVLPVMVRVYGFLVPLLFLNSIHGFVPNWIVLLKLICTTSSSATLTSLFIGLVLVTTGGAEVVNLVVKGAANPFPARSVILLVCSITVYFLPASKSALGVIESTFPVMLEVNGTAAPVPLVSLSSIHELWPNLIASLKVIFITLFKATINALSAGLVLVTWGGVISRTFNVLVLLLAAYVLSWKNCARIVYVP